MLDYKVLARTTDKVNVVGSVNFPRLSPLLYLFYSLLFSNFYTDIRRRNHNYDNYDKVD